MENRLADQDVRSYVPGSIHAPTTRQEEENPMTTLKNKVAETAEHVKNVVTEAVDKVGHAAAEAYQKGDQAVTDAARKAKDLAVEGADKLKEASNKAANKVGDAKPSNGVAKRPSGDRMKGAR